METWDELSRSSDSQVRGTSLRSETSCFTWRFTGLTIAGKWRLTRQRSGSHPSILISLSTVAVANELRLNTPLSSPPTGEIVGAAMLR